MQRAVGDGAGDVRAAWSAAGGDPDGWPTEEQWAALAAADGPATSPPRAVRAGDDGVVRVVVELPQPAFAALELRPA